MKKWPFILALPAIALFSLTQCKDHNMSSLSSSALVAEVASDYATAPEDIRAIALAIRQGEVPDQALLDQLGSEALSVRYLSDSQQKFFLLNDTMLHDNFPAAKALVEAGADVNYQDHTMVFNAIQMHQGPMAVPFPDFSPGIPFLKLYLENGGDPNAPYKRDNTYDPPLHVAHNNLEGVLVLLEHGADPWLRVPTPHGIFGDGYLDYLAFASGNGIYAEQIFRIAHAGYFKGASAQELETVLGTFRKFLTNDEGSRAQDDLLQNWQWNAILEAIFDTTGATPDPELARLMKNRVSDEYGGWWMRPDQIRTGDEFVGPMITNGTLIWTHRNTNPKQRPDK